MSVQATTNWYIRAGGSSTNGGGYDPGISGAGTNYCDQNAAQLTLTDLATTGITSTLTSVTGGFTSAMIGNCFLITSGTNFTAGYYFVTAVASSNSCTLDRAPTTGAGVSGHGSLGGAFASIGQLANGGSASQPSVTTPLAAGHTINLRGAGSSNPSSVDYSQTGYYQFPNGDNSSNGCIVLIGYNGTPFIQADGQIFYQLKAWRLVGCKFSQTGNAGGRNQTINGSGNLVIVSCIFDANGVDIQGAGAVDQVYNCAFINTGSTSAGSQPAIEINDDAALIHSCYINGWRGYGVRLTSGGGTSGGVVNCIIVNCSGTSIGAISFPDSQSNYYNYFIINNTIDGNAGDGIRLAAAQSIQSCVILNNLITNNGGYGINTTVGTLALNTRLNGVPPNYNDIYNNTSGSRNNYPAGAQDLAVDPQYTNRSGANYAIGANVQAKGFPGAFLLGATTGYLDIGAVQHQSSSAATYVINQIINQYQTVEGEN